MRVAQPLVLKEDVRRKLEQLAHGRSIGVRVVVRSRIVPLCADGLENKQIASSLRVAPRMVALWSGRFRELEWTVCSGMRPVPDALRRSLLK